MKKLEGKTKSNIEFDFREMFYYWTLMLMIGYTLRAILAMNNGELFISLI